MTAAIMYGSLEHYDTKAFGSPLSISACFSSSTHNDFIMQSFCAYALNRILSAPIYGVGVYFERMYARDTKHIINETPQGGIVYAIEAPHSIEATFSMNRPSEKRILKQLREQVPSAKLLMKDDSKEYIVSAMNRHSAHFKAGEVYRICSIPSSREAVSPVYVELMRPKTLQGNGLPHFDAPPEAMIAFMKTACDVYRVKRPLEERVPLIRFPEKVFG